MHGMHGGLWGSQHYKVIAKKANGELQFEGGWQNNRHRSAHASYRMIENVFEELDAPGEWYHDTKEGWLYYKPAAGVDMGSATFEAVLQIKHLVEFYGEHKKPVAVMEIAKSGNGLALTRVKTYETTTAVKHIHLEGIHFTGTARTFMETIEPLLRSDWTLYRGGAVHLRGTEDVVIEGCSFEELGGNAVVVDSYNRDTVIRGNLFRENGASDVVFVGSFAAVRDPAFSFRASARPLTKIDTVVGPKSEDYPADGIGHHAALAGHEAAKETLIASLGNAPGRYPSDPSTLDLLEEIVHHTLQTGHLREALDIYKNRIGELTNLGYKLSDFQRGLRLCEQISDAFESQEVIGSTQPSSPLRVSTSPLGRLYLDHACYLWALGRVTEARHKLEHALSVATSESCLDRCTKSHAINALVWMLIDSGQLREAVAMEALSIEGSLCTENPNSHSRDTFKSLSVCQVFRGDIGEGLLSLQRSIKCHNEIRDEGGAEEPAALLPFVDPLVRLGRISQAHLLASNTLSTEAEACLTHLWCQLSLVVIRLASHNSTDNAPKIGEVKDWALARDTRDLLCRCYLTEAQNILDQSSRPFQSESKPQAAAALKSGLKIARTYGYSLYHIDLLIARARLHLLTGHPSKAVDDIRVALEDGIPAKDRIGQPELFAARNEDCGYAWPVPEGLQLKAEALLLKAAQEIGTDFFVPARRDQLSAETNQLITQAEALLKEALELWQPLHDPDPERDDQNFKLNGKEYNYKAVDTHGVITDLAGGVLTRHTLRAATLKTRITQNTSGHEPRKEEAESMSATISPRVFVSYTHDSDAHSQLVLNLANQLRDDGVEAHIDQYILNPREGWPMWMYKEIEEADFVLMVSTERYAVKAQEPKKSGGRFESVLILQDLLDAGMSNDKFIPVFFEATDSDHILKWVRPVNYYNVSTTNGYDSLLRRLLDDPAVVPPPVGTPRKKGPANP